jgi:hypothetical protein
MSLKIRSIFTDLKKQATRLVPFMAAAYIPAILVLSFLVFLRTRYSLPYYVMTVDPLSVFAAPPYIGLLSNIGAILWAAGLGACLLTAIKAKEKETRTLFGYLGLLTFVLLIDDLFMVHEYIIPRYLGLTDPWTFSAYGLLLIFIVLKTWRQMIKTDYLLIVAALILFAGSLYFDWLPTEIRGQFLLEDGLKFLGIVSWIAYLFREAFKAK